MISKLTVNSLRDQLHNYCAVRQLYQGDSVSLSLEQARDLLTYALGIAVDIEAVSPAAEVLGTTDATLPPLPWDDIEAWLEVRDTKEVAADIRAYGAACAAAAAHCEPTDEQIIAVMRDGYRCNYNDNSEHIEFARTILALRSK